MAQSFFWYDLETTGIDCKDGRVMQFAGQRTDMELNPVGEPVNLLIQLSDDILPEPDAVLITGITPQQTLQHGITEAAFMQIFTNQVATPDTIFVGYNTVRFDDEFMRCLHYRNFYDAYEWQWKDGRSRWDLLDVVRMTRALRPEGINWPMTEDGKPTNRLELLTKLNGLEHAHAHDALNDVLASIAVARLIREKQPKLFDWLLRLRDKKAVKQFIEQNKTFIYSSGKYANDTEKTAVVQVLHTDDSKGAILYDLRVDPTEFLALSAEELMERWRYSKEESAPPRLPAKTMKYNRCPAVTTPGFITEPAVQERLKITPELVEKHRSLLKHAPDFIANVVRARDLMDDERGERWSRESPAAEAAIYEGGFFDDHDKQLMSVVRAAKPDELSVDALVFHDRRLSEMLPRYKARNFAETLSDQERAAWEEYRHQTLLDGGDQSKLATFMRRLAELAETEAGQAKLYLLEELQLYAESIMPYVDEA
jgi:exodeoxyribonuclease-1